MKKTLWTLAAAMMVLVMAVFTYYTIVVLKARNYTRAVISQDLQKKSWRQLHGTIQPLSLERHDLTQRQIDILLAVQDPGFYKHNGIDLATPGAGITTLTQSVVKKLYFEKFTQGIAKIKQTVIAVFAFDPLIAKTDQLSLFINIMYFGNVNGKPIVGFEEAARSYYHKPFTLLSEDEYISSVAMIVAPQTFHLLHHPEWNEERVRRIKKLISGEYKPKGLMDQYYGTLPPEVIEGGLPPFSYFEK